MDSKTKHLPHIAVMTKKYSQNKQYVLARLEMSEAAYHTLQFNTAIAWLRSTVWLRDDDVINYLMSLPEFWVWFINQWNIRDDAFYHTHFDAFVNPACNIDELKTLWFTAHCAAAIAEVLPDDILKKLFQWANGREVFNG